MLAYCATAFNLGSGVKRSFLTSKKLIFDITSSKNHKLMMKNNSFDYIFQRFDTDTQRKVVARKKCYTKMWSMRSGYNFHIELQSNL